MKKITLMYISIIIYPYAKFYCDVKALTLIVYKLFWL